MRDLDALVHALCVKFEADPDFDLLSADRYPHILLPEVSDAVRRQVGKIARTGNRIDRLHGFLQEVLHIIRGGPLGPEGRGLRVHSDIFLGELAMPAIMPVQEMLDALRIATQVLGLGGVHGQIPVAGHGIALERRRGPDHGG